MRNRAALLLFLVALAYAPLFAPGRDPLDGGWTSEAATYRERLRDGVRTLGRVPAWDPYHAGGVPFLAETHNAVLYPPTWLAVLLPAGEGIRLALLLHLLVAAGGAWRLARVSGLEPPGAAAAALVYALGGFLPIQRWFGAHDVLGAAAWWPLLLSFLEEAASGRPGRWAPAAAAAALLLLAGRPEAPYFALLGAAVFLCARAAVDDRPRDALRRGVAAGAAAAAGAALLALPFLLALVDYLPRVPRAGGAGDRFAEIGFDAFSFPWWWSPTLAAPYLFDVTPGTPWSHGAPWGRCWIGGAGAVLLLLGLRRGPRRVALPHAALAAFGLLAAMGEGGPLGPFLVRLPLWTSLRGAARGLFVPLASLGLLVGLGVDRAGAATAGRRAPAGLLLVGGLLAALLAAPAADPAGGVLRRAEGARAALRRSDEAAHERAREALDAPDGGAAFRAERRRGALRRTLRRAGGIGLRPIVAGAGVAAASAGAALLLLRAGRPPAAAALLVGTELVALALFLTLPARPPPAADRAWREGRPPLPAAVVSPHVRVDGPLDLIAGTARGLHFVGTSSPFGYAPYVRLALAAPSAERLDRLGVDAVVALGSPPPGFVDAGPVDLGGETPPRLFVRGTPVGRFRWDGAGAARVEISSYEPDLWRLAVEASAPGRVVAADAFDPWWRASVGGRPAPVAEAHGALLSVAVPAGRSDVVLSYDPPFLSPAALISAAAGAALLFLLVRGSGRSRTP